METNKKYYQISVSPEPEIIGVNNGVYQLEIDDSAIEKNKIFDEFIEWFDYKNKSFWDNQDKIRQLESPLIKGKMLKKAIITDIMGYSPEYFGMHAIYSQKFIDILKTFDIGEYSVFNFDIKNVFEKYFLLFINTIVTPEIIFDKSVIYTGHKIMDNVKYHHLNNFQDYKSFKENLPLARFEKIAIPKKYYGRDLLSVQSTVDLFCSEKLVDFLLDCKITGLQVAYNNSIQLEFI